MTFKKVYVKRCVSFQQIWRHLGTHTLKSKWCSILEIQFCGPWGPLKEIGCYHRSLLKLRFKVSMGPN